MSSTINNNYHGNISVVFFTYPYYEQTHNDDIIYYDEQTEETDIVYYDEARYDEQSDDETHISYFNYEQSKNDDNKFYCASHYPIIVTISIHETGYDYEMENSIIDRIKVIKVKVLHSEQWKRKDLIEFIHDRIPEKKIIRNRNYVNIDKKNISEITMKIINIDIDESLSFPYNSCDTDLEVSEFCLKKTIEFDYDGLLVEKTY